MLARPPASGQQPAAHQGLRRGLLVKGCLRNYTSNRAAFATAPRERRAAKPWTTSSPPYRGTASHRRGASCTRPI